MNSTVQAQTVPLNKDGRLKTSSARTNPASHSLQPVPPARMFELTFSVTFSLAPSHASPKHLIENVLKFLSGWSFPTPCGTETPEVPNALYHQNFFKPCCVCLCVESPCGRNQVCATLPCRNVKCGHALVSSILDIYASSRPSYSS